MTPPTTGNVTAVPPLGHRSYISGLMSRDKASSRTAFSHNFQLLNVTPILSQPSERIASICPTVFPCESKGAFPSVEMGIPHCQRINAHMCVTNKQHDKHNIRVRQTDSKLHDSGACAFKRCTRLCSRPTASGEGGLSGAKVTLHRSFT